MIPVNVAFWILVAALLAGFTGGCTFEHVRQADKQAELKATIKLDEQVALRHQKKQEKLEADLVDARAKGASVQVVYRDKVKAVEAQPYAKDSAEAIEQMAIYAPDTVSQWSAARAAAAKETP